MFPFEVLSAVNESTGHACVYGDGSQVASSATSSSLVPQAYDVVIVAWVFCLGLLWPLTHCLGCPLRTEALLGDVQLQPRSYRPILFAIPLPESTSFGEPHLLRSHADVRGDGRCGYRALAIHLGVTWKTVMQSVVGSMVCSRCAQT